MRGRTKPTMTWDEAPDTITPKELSQILGIGIEGARNLFDKVDFPKISKKDIGNIGKADKEAVRLYLQGIKFSNNGKEALLTMIYFELKKLNSKLPIEEGEVENETNEQEKINR